MGETRIVLDEAYLDLAERRKPGLKAALLAVRVPDFTPPPGQVALLYREWRRLAGPPSPQTSCGRRAVVAPFVSSRLRACGECPGRPTCSAWASGDCHGRAYLRRPQACCPLDPPRWRPEKPPNDVCR